MDLRWLIVEMTFHLCIKNVKITILLKLLYVLINIINLRIIHKFWEIIFCIENSQLCHAVFHHAYVHNSGPRGHLCAVLIHVGYHLQGRHILDSENHQLFSCSACKTVLKISPWQSKMNILNKTKLDGNIGVLFSVGAKLYRTFSQGSSCSLKH